MSDQLERNEQNAQAFYDLMFNQCKSAEAVERYVGDVSIARHLQVAVGILRRKPGTSRDVR